MTTAPNRVRWTTADMALFPDDGKRYEISAGELSMTRAPSWSHQEAAGRIFSVYLLNRLLGVVISYWLLVVHV